LQGRPESGALWERTINALMAELGFMSTTHEKSIYSVTIQGKKVLLCCQVNDLAVACSDPEISKMVIAHLASKIKLTNDGLLTSFNGVDVKQAHKYIKISCTSYIHWMLKSHSWDQGSPNES
jgi:Reverse transcriptase (RNA-dependent DNA polymerase)